VDPGSPQKQRLRIGQRVDHFGGASPQAPWHLGHLFLPEATRHRRTQRKDQKMLADLAAHLSYGLKPGGTAVVFKHVWPLKIASCLADREAEEAGGTTLSYTPIRCNSFTSYF
jgi:hypothetical protein